MTNYERDILEHLKGETPKQKYNYLIALEGVVRDLLKFADENNLYEHDFIVDAKYLIN